MTRPFRCLPALTAFLLCLAALAAEAQPIQPGGPGQRARGRTGITTSPQMPDPGGTRNLIGPRLEPGAVLCRTPEGLGQRQAAMAAATAGDEDQLVVPAGCVLIGARTPVEVLERRGSGRTKVKTLGRTEETGWTDAYLPDRPR